MKITQIKEICIYSRDLERARHFYSEILGLPVINYLPGRHVFFSAGKSVLLCFNPDDSKAKKNPPAHFTVGPGHFAFEVKSVDYEDHKEEITAKGIEITDQVTWADGQQSFYFNDPDGNVLEIVPEGIWG